MEKFIFAFTTIDDIPVVAIAYKSDWEKFGYCSDFYTEEDWEILTPLLENELGMGELMECHWEYNRPMEEIQEALVKAGMTRDAAFEEFEQSF